MGEEQQSDVESVTGVKRKRGAVIINPYASLVGFNNNCDY